MTDLSKSRDDLNRCVNILPKSGFYMFLNVFSLSKHPSKGQNLVQRGSGIVFPRGYDNPKLDVFIPRHFDIAFFPSHL